MSEQTIAQLWRSVAGHDDLAPAESDPFTEEDALDEAQVLDVRVDAVNGLVGVLLELRLAMGFTDGDTALLVLRDVESFSWRAEPAAGRRVREVSGVAVDRSGGRVRLSLELGRGQALTCAGSSAQFYVLEVEGLDEAPPDYTGDDEDVVQEGLAQWHSPCRVLQAARS